MADKHMASKAHEDLHKELKETIEGGRCLTGHSSAYKDKKSCTYRWQFLQKPANDRHGLLKFDKRRLTREDEEKGKVASSRYFSKKGKVYPVAYSAMITLPEQPDDWAVGGPKRSGVKAPNGKDITKGMNFTNMYQPYWNNAHHIIPKGTLKECINKLKEKDPETGELMIVGLLRADYNVNHWINVMILPMDKEVARLLRLPRHLALEDETIVAEVEKFDHPGYNKKVKNKLDQIIESYKKTIDQAREGLECNAWPVVKLSKEKLEKLSKELFDKIKNFGKSNPGLPLSDMVF